MRGPDALSLQPAPAVGLLALARWVERARLAASTIARASEAEPDLGPTLAGYGPGIPEWTPAESEGLTSLTLVVQGLTVSAAEGAAPNLLEAGHGG